MSSRQRSRRATVKKPSFLGWATSDEDEIARRRERARTEKLICRKLHADQGVYGEYDITGASTRTYRVEIRALLEPINSCSCRDFQVNGLGTCKHIEVAVRRLSNRARAGERRAGSQVNEIYLNMSAQRVTWRPPDGQSSSRRTHSLLKPYFDTAGRLRGDPNQSLTALRQALVREPARVQREIRVSGHLDNWLEGLRQRSRRLTLRDELERDLQSGRRTLELTKCPLYPYQQEGVLHLACNGRALLADEMGLGKTVQAVAAGAFLKELHDIRRVLVISPASLKGEWLEQIEKFTHLPATIVEGHKRQRHNAYQSQCFFLLANYEQIRHDLHFINEEVRPDLIVLDEAQRIKNWQTKTAAAIKSLRSPYAFVLTGTPLENRIDEIYSIVEFLDPWLFGPLFRFNREFYELDERGRPTGYKNLDELHRRLQAIMLRRRKQDVEGELPDRTEKHYFTPLVAEQVEQYEEHSTRVARLMNIAKRRPLKKEEMDQLQMHLACMRMACDTPFILDQASRVSPKLDELRRVIPDLMLGSDRKVIVFSEWERMLRLVADMLSELGFEYAWHTGSVSQKRRRREIKRFRDEPYCRFFLATDSAATGLNLQAASVVVNLDLPWNPAKLEQRIARAWRKHQTRSVSVLYFIAENTIEHRMLDVLRMKSELADEVVDGAGRTTAMKLPSGRRALVQRVESLVGNDASGDGRVATGRAPERPSGRHKSPMSTICVRSEAALSRGATDQQQERSLADLPFPARQQPSRWCSAPRFAPRSVPWRQMVGSVSTIPILRPWSGRYRRRWMKTKTGGPRSTNTSRSPKDVSRRRSC